MDIIISEPIGVLLVHERMLESYLYARDHYLKPDGLLLPNAGKIFLAPVSLFVYSTRHRVIVYQFTDSNLWSQTNAKVRFWEQNSFYGVDFSSLATEAKAEVFGQPVIGYFDSRVLIAPTCSYDST